jgi:hypothetical protein
MIEFIAHTAPELNIPSKNQETYVLTPSISCTGEYRKIPAKNPNQVPKHIGQLVIFLINVAIELNGNPDSDHFLINSLGALKMLP